MNPAEIIERAVEDGIMLAASSYGRLSLKGSKSVIDRWLSVLRANKRAILHQLQENADTWPADDWRVFYDERAAIAEYDGSLPRPEAEALAHDCCVEEWLNRHPVCSSPDRCLECGQGERSHEPLVPFGTSKTVHAWLHHACRDAWHARRKKEATAALKALGIEDGSGEK